ncbi:sigma-54-dependent Fis family transcriptional regulator [Clostridium formicaceticum]|uniref:Acetoin dehydrogenase operon transcriptional activator AcoR n=1 Tax=Clostridium formicaceticum TaxID=1497 RepID=A0AAC9RJY9_9CLOT|nr:sigma 54-interacting transcriptional regulator [Clostridium formicaceticum]AOY76461.1 sigma-54-dependent Fis family transcriptional regulator [Clostridium formicaceticum]ARE86860.1 Acetoin dehydrogenase operon transcriptional activator AcoR [Clostridium formicaceticum]
MLDKNTLKPIIERSHARCKKLGVDINQVASKTVISGFELQNKLSYNKDLILTAKPYMEQLNEFVKGSSFFALLTDGEGCILNALGDDEILSEAFEMKMIPGAYMNEENIGTNAMAIIIKEKVPIQMSGKEHYIKAYHKWTCSAAPIKDIYGNVIGILNLTGYMEDAHLHTLGMVIAASNAIEEMLKVKQYSKTSCMTQRQMKLVFDSIPVGIITTDVNGKVLSANKKAVEMFGYIEYELKRKSLKDLVENWEKIKKAIYSGKSYCEKDQLIYGLNNKILFDITAHPAYNSDENIMEITFIFQEVKKPRKLANKLEEGRAIYTFDKIVTENQDFRNIIQYAKKISDSKSTILITGESGTGKELFAQSIHNYSRRMDEPFVALNCGAIPKELIEAELFGYEEGSFTGAKKGGSNGKFEIANGGTIFLDEIGEMPLEMQTKLLRVIQEGMITRIGSSKSMYVDVRVIAATNKNLRREVEENRFRKDLYYRLNVLPLNLPPLRKRIEDIVPLTRYFMKSLSKSLNKKEVEIPDEYIQHLINYNWPGNVRELENVVELIINTENFPVMTSSQHNEMQVDQNWLSQTSSESLKLEEIEKDHLIKVLNICKGNVSQAAKTLGIRRNTLYNKINKYNLN